MFTDCSNQKWLLHTQLIGQFAHCAARQMLRGYCCDLKDRNISHLHWVPPEYTWLPQVISKPDNYSSGTNWNIKVKSENYHQEDLKAKAERRRGSLWLTVLPFTLSQALNSFKSSPRYSSTHTISNVGVARKIRRQWHGKDAKKWTF